MSEEERESDESIASLKKELRKLDQIDRDEWFREYYCEWIPREEKNEQRLS